MPTTGGLSPEPEPHLLVWGKTDRSGVNQQAGRAAWNPLLAHSLDTAAVTLLLFDDYLADPVRHLLAETFGQGEPARARKMVALLAALHDIPGKACSEFLKLFYPSRDKHGLRAAARRWEGEARTVGLPLVTNLEQHPSIAHAKVTARLLPRLLGCACRRCGSDGLKTPTLHMVGDLLGGHHGHIPNADQLSGISIDSCNKWENIHQALIGDLARLLDIDQRDVKQTVAKPARPAAMPLFAGLVVLADWLASNESFFTYRDAATPTLDWWASSQREAIHAVDSLNLRRWPVEQATWSTLFGEQHQPRPAQQAVMRLLPRTGPAMVIVEADTGSGKTEAAWWAAHHLTLTNGYHGMYMALPSRASTEQAAMRAATFVSASLAGDIERANLAVVHGTAAASAVAEELLQAAASPGSAVAPDDINLICGDELRAVLDEWFLASKRGLLSPFGIGTVDQIVLSVQKSRFWFLRLFGLAQKVVIIDEAHAYELYQQTLLSQAVTWLADAGASVIVLSATLPASAKNLLIDAWCLGRKAPLSRNDQTTNTITVIDANGMAVGDSPKAIANNAAAPQTAYDGALELITPKAFMGPASASLEHRWARTILEEVRDRGIVAVVRNRVDSAVDLYTAVCELAEEYGWTPDTEVLLLHGRLLERDRNRIQRHLINLLGPHPDRELRDIKPNPQRPPRMLLIATQVIEQSLDLDFDLMISDLCPVDLAIQRRGRVRRHHVNDSGRAPHLNDITPLRLLWLPSPNRTPLVAYPDNIDGAVYAPYLLAATWHVLTEDRDTPRRQVISSDQIPALIETVYGQQAVRGRTPELDRLLQFTWHDMQNNLTEERLEAEARMVPAYLGHDDDGPEVADLSSDWLNGEETDQGLPAHLGARSRLGADSYDVVCLFKQSDGKLTWDQAGQNPADLKYYDRTKQPAQYREQLRQLLLNTIRIPHRWFQQGKWPPPNKWPLTGNGPIRIRPTLLFDSVGTCIHGLPGKITLTQKTGLQRTGSLRPSRARYRRPRSSPLE
ncbi:CRISPR-associated helicase Cas3' [Nonomuraea sp. CA-143628]|uniref:CRISPR-associated helicase Cas3' n=1 Tax=Nonomuraea sp. CA-143628 TaxID=3239997 RepID=UPI003D8DACD6